ncbi:glycosyltransferase family 4 protein [Bacteroidia bacterium]|jgi:glycosyltransferase involved in cell wall biosynthesis|nr:glycosyltransferase family 4 protein [Bacteroidia bacterium]
MKIGFDAKRYFNNITGLGNYSRWLIDNLNKKIPQSIFLFHTDRPPIDSENLTVFTPKYNLLRSLWRSWSVTRKLKKERIDIYHGLSNEIPFGIHKTEIKSIVTIHDLINKRYPENYPLIDRWVYNLKLSYAQKHADVIITVSEQTKKDIIHYYNTDETKIKVIPIGMSRSKTKSEQSSVPYILCVSSFTKRKNLKALVHAFKSIESKNVNLKIAGSQGDTSQDIIKLAQDDPRIELHFNISDEQLDNLYTKCQFCIYPSLFEGFGIPILEAFSYGKTIATSNVSSMPEVGKDAAMYFNPKDSISIRKSILHLMDDDVRNNFENKIPNTLKSFDSEVLINAYKSVYIELMTTI